MKKLSIVLMCILVLISCQKQNKHTAKKGTFKKQRWKLVTSFPKSLTSLWETVYYLTDNTHILSDNQLKIKIFQPGELVPALGVFDAVSEGSVEMGFTAGNYYIGKNKAFILDTGEPFGMTTPQKNAWLYEHGGLELIQELYKKYNIMYFPLGNTGVQMGGWFRNEIHSLNDLKGLRVRISSLGGVIYDQLGATVQMLGGGEIYMALEQGALDGAEFVGPYDDEKLGFQNIAKYYYTPGWQETTGTLALYINLQKWNELPLKIQKTIENVSKACNLLMSAKYNARNSASLKKIKAEGVQIKKFDTEILEAAEKQNNILLESYMKEPDFAKIYNAIKAFQKQSDDWFFENEYQLLRFKNRNRK